MTVKKSKLSNSIKQSSNNHKYNYICLFIISIVIIYYIIKENKDKFKSSKQIESFATPDIIGDFDSVSLSNNNTTVNIKLRTDADTAFRKNKVDIVIYFSQKYNGGDVNDNTIFYKIYLLYENNKFVYSLGNQNNTRISYLSNGIIKVQRQTLVDAVVNTYSTTDKTIEWGTNVFYIKGLSDEVNGKEYTIPTLNMKTYVPNLIQDSQKQYNRLKGEFKSKLSKMSTDYTDLEYKINGEDQKTKFEHQGIDNHTYFIDYYKKKNNIDDDIELNTDADADADFTIEEDTSIADCNTKLQTTTDKMTKYREYNKNLYKYLFDELEKIKTKNDIIKNETGNIKKQEQIQVLGNNTKHFKRGVINVGKFQLISDFEIPNTP
jgi:hypothetical protein